MNSAIYDPQSPVVVSGLTRRFGKKTALDNVSLSIPPGCVFGLVGENGAGKTTLIKHLLGLLRPQAGSVRVFGVDPVAAPELALARIGYLSENRDLPGWMRLRELMLYVQAFYPNWDERYAEELVSVFGLDPAQKIKHLSRGQKAQAGLLTALAYRPELLLLDEPSSGLDAVVRRDILSAIIQTVANEGRTVLFSSHLLDEVERVADRVAMIHQGRLVLCDTLDAIKESHHRLVLRFDADLSAPPSLSGALHWSGKGREWTMICDGALATLKEAAAQTNGRVVEEDTPTLEEIFVARVKGAPRASKEG